VLAEQHKIFQAYQVIVNFFSSEIKLNNCSAFHLDLDCLEINEALSDYNFSPDDTVVTGSVRIKVAYSVNIDIALYKR